MQTITTTKKRNKINCNVYVVSFFFLNGGQNTHASKVYLYLCNHFAVDFTGNNMKLGEFPYQAYFHSKQVWMVVAAKPKKKKKKEMRPNFMWSCQRSGKAFVRICCCNCICTSGPPQTSKDLDIQRYLYGLLNGLLVKRGGFRTLTHLKLVSATGR